MLNWLINLIEPEPEPTPVPFYHDGLLKFRGQKPAPLTVTDGSFFIIDPDDHSTARDKSGKRWKIVDCKLIGSTHKLSFPWPLSSEDLTTIKDLAPKGANAINTTHTYRFTSSRGNDGAVQLEKPIMVINYCHIAVEPV